MHKVQIFISEELYSERNRVLRYDSPIDNSSVFSKLMFLYDILEQASKLLYSS